MNIKKTVDTCCNLLSEIATEITHHCPDRSSVMEIYVGSGFSHLQLALFKPILLENYAFFCFCLKNEGLRHELQLDAEDLISSLGLDTKTFLQTRFEEYSATADSSKLFLEYCVYVINTKQNAPDKETIHEGDLGNLENKTLLILQLSARKMQESSESV